MTTEIDRRKFITYTGAAGAATGALWVAPSVVGSSSAFALNSLSSCTYAGTLMWAHDTWASGGTGNDSWVGGNLNGGKPSSPDNSSNGAQRSFVAKVGGTGNSFVWVKATVTASGPPRLNNAGGTPWTGGPRLSGYNGKEEYLLASKTAATNPATTSGGYSMEIEFFSDSSLNTAATVTNLSFDIRDIDGKLNATPLSYHELVWITGASGSVSRSTNGNIGGAGTSADPWNSTASTTDLVPPAGDITVSITSASSFTVHGANDGAGADKNHGWSIGNLTWGC